MLPTDKDGIKGKRTKLPYEQTRELSQRGRKATVVVERSSIGRIIGPVQSNLLSARKTLLDAQCCQGAVDGRATCVQIRNSDAHQGARRSRACWSGFFWVVFKWNDVILDPCVRKRHIFDFFERGRKFFPANMWLAYVVETV
jgi:hypothetical protein